MNKFKMMAFLIGLFALAGCSTKPPKQTQPYGDLKPVFEEQNKLNERV